MTTQHTPTPWKVDGNRIIQRFHNESWNKQVPASFEDVVIGTFNSCDQAEFAARAVNAHQGLLEALKDAQAVIHDLAVKGQFFDDRNCRMGLEGKINDAIAKAEGSNG